MPTPTIYDKFNKTLKPEDFPSYEAWKKSYHGPDNGSNYSYAAYERDKSRRLMQAQQIMQTRQEAAKWDRLETRLGSPQNVDYWTPNNIRSSRNGTLNFPQSTNYQQPTVWYNGNMPTSQSNINANNQQPTVWYNGTTDVEQNQNNANVRPQTVSNTTPAPAVALPKQTTTTRAKSVITTKPNDTVASIWTRVTGLPWKAAKELGLSDGSYATNIEILKGLKSGKITKESIAALQEAKNATPYESAPETYSMPAQPTIERPTLPISEPTDMTPPSERKLQMAAYGGWFY